MSGINNIKKLLSYSYSDSDIRYYFPNAKIMEYKDLWITIIYLIYFLKINLMSLY